MKFEISATIAGSFKFKPEIDIAREEFENLNVTVLAPNKGWVFLPNDRYLTGQQAAGFRPLPGEQDSPRHVEDTFLACIRNSDLLYVVCPEGYAGSSVMFEI